MPGPVATKGSMHICPMCTGLVPHVGGPITEGESTILVNGKPIATIGSLCTCAGAPDTVAQGSPFVFANGKPVACVGDLTAHGGTIIIGENNVVISSATPTPSVNMPKNKVPFPEINFVDRITSPSKIKEAVANQEKLKEETKGEPSIYNLQWVKEKQVIRDSKVLKEITLQAYVTNLDDGETIKFKIKKPVKNTDEAGNIITSEDDIIELSGIVKDNKVEVTWELEDPEANNDKNKKLS